MNPTPVGDEVPPAAPHERRRAVLLFLLTTLSVYWTYGTEWMGGDPFSDPAVAWGSIQYAAGLMAILLAHEMGHYVVARRHGVHMSLPYFLPVPAFFGTFGAIIRLRTLPRSRTALLEMGAAGPIAGFAVTLVVMALGMSGIVAHGAPELSWPLPPPAPPGWSDQLLQWPPILWALTALSSMIPGVEGNGVPLMIMANPPVMDVLGDAMLGAPPGRYDSLSPLAMAGWVGCMLTAINLIPIGQLDGGHVLNALAPSRAKLVSRLGVGCAILAGVAWPGWAFWGVLLLVMRAWVSLPVREQPGLSRRAIAVACVTLVVFLLSFMPTPVEVEEYGLDELHFVDASGHRVPTDVVQAAIDAQLATAEDQRLGTQPSDTGGEKRGPSGTD